MRPSTIVAWIALGLASLAVVLALRSGPPNAAAGDAGADRVDRLERELAALHERVAQLERAGSDELVGGTSHGSRASAEPEAADELDELRSELAALRAELRAGGSTGGEEADRVFHRRVAGVVADLRREETFELVREQLTARAARVDDDVLRYSDVREDERLDAAQASRFRAALEAQIARELVQLQLIEEDAPADQLAAIVERDLATFSDEIGACLGPVGRTAYWADYLGEDETKQSLLRPVLAQPRDERR